jgi:hypothetical protein
VETVIVARSQVQYAVVSAAAGPWSRRRAQQGAERIREAFDLKSNVVLGAAYSKHFAIGWTD